MNDPGDSKGPVEEPHVGHGDENSDTKAKGRMKKNVKIESVPMDNSRGVLCSICPERAFKSCFSCMASFCKEHVKMHYKVPALQKHQLVEATEDLGQGLCLQHYRPLELFCKTDQTAVCSICALQHFGHEITDQNMPKKENGSTTVTREDKLALHHQKFPFQKDTFPKEKLAVEEHLIKKGSLNCYKLPTQRSNIGKNIRRWTFGTKDSKRKIKTILLVGETGAGKTTLLNTMVNYMLGVEPKDGFWFEITEDEKKSQIESQTAVVTVYEVFVKTSSLSLRIIDTPGYGSTDGIDLDLEVAESLLYLFRSDSEDGIHEINVVGLVVKSGQNRLTEFHSYVLNAILSLFGQDIGGSIVPLITHSDGISCDNVITSLDKAEVPCAKDNTGNPVYFMFNNRQSEAYKKENEDQHWHVWDLGYRNMEHFLRFLQGCDRKEVKQTENVLRQRKTLEARACNLKTEIEKEEGKQDELRQTLKGLEENKNEIAKNEKSSFPVEEILIAMFPIDQPWYELTKKAMYCTTCQENCHYPGCWWVKDLSRCSVVNDGRCTVCTGKCPVSHHKKEKCFYKAIKIKKEMNIEMLREKYGNQVNMEKVLQKEIEVSKRQMKMLLKDAYDCILKLEEIALERDSMYLFIHLEFLIKKMKEIGDEDSAKRLEDIEKRNSDIQYGRLVRWLSQRISKTFK